VAVGSLAGAVHLVEFVVEEEVLLLLVDEPALVGVGGADVGGRGDLDGVLLVGDVGNGQGVLVVVEADLVASVLLVRALVDDALGCRG
jgi:hypothetical protein